MMDFSTPSLLVFQLNLLIILCWNEMMGTVRENHIYSQFLATDHNNIMTPETAGTLFF